MIGHELFRDDGSRLGCDRGSVFVRHKQILPLNKYSSLNGVDDASEARFFLVTS